MRDARLQFCLRYKDWTLEQWKNVIWTDETSILLGHRRGSYKIWRRVGERCTRTCIRERWKGFSEFMFWGSFTYYFKGPCHIWHTEKAKESKNSLNILKGWNDSIENDCRSRWQSVTEARRAAMRHRKGNIKLTPWLIFLLVTL